MINHVYFVLAVRINEGKRPDLQALMRELVESSSAEPGTVNYEWSLSDDQAECHVYERYADSDALLASPSPCTAPAVIAGGV